MKILKYSLLSLLALIVLLFAYQYYQKSKMKAFKPRMESKESLLHFLKSNQHIDSNTVLIAKDLKSFEALQNSYGVGSIYIYDSHFNIVDNNITSENGNCFADISENICNGFKIQNPKFIEKIKDRYPLLLDKTVYLNGKNSHLNDYDYIIVYSWAKFLPPTFDKETLAFIDCLKSKKILLLSLNLDYLNTWELSNDLKKELNSK